MFDWSDAQYFLAVHRAGTLSGAARRLGVNQSTVGRRLASLEAALGEQLFVRTSDGYALTDTGAELAPRFEAIEAEAFSVERLIAGSAAAVSGRVRLTAPRAFTSMFLATRLAALLRRHVELEIDMVAENTTLSLSKREADVALRFQRPSGGHLQTRKLGDVGWALYASNRYLAARGRPSGTEYRGHTVLGFGDMFSDAQEGKWLARNARNAAVPLHTDDDRTLLAGAESGVGIALLPHYVACTSRRLSRISEPNPVVRSIWLVVHEDLAHAGRVRAVSDYLGDVISAAADTLLVPA